MKPVLDWIKSNWFIVACILVMVISLPVLLYFGSSMTSELVEQRRKTISDEYRSLQANTVSFAIPGLRPGERELERSEIVNEELISQYREAGRKRLEELATIAESAEAFNRRDHGVLSEVLFPEPSREVRDTEPRVFGRAVGGAHRELVRRAGAGGPPDPENLADELRDYQARELERLRAASGQDDPTEEEAERLRQELTDYRIGRYRERAGNLSFYAVPELVFEGIRFDALEGQLPPLTVAWDWQEKLWINTDLIEAVQKANAASPGNEEGVPGAVVKRLVSIETAPPVYIREGSRGRDDPMDAMGGGAAPADPNRVVQPNYQQSLTGRFTSANAQNGVYDVRPVRMTVVVSAERLNTLIDAISQTNFMTVTGLQLEQVDRLQHLREGYWYGPEPIVQARLEIETVWLRSWRERWMPPAVRQALGLPPRAETQNNGNGPA